MKKQFSFLLILTYIVFLSACGGGGMNEKDLTGTKWMLDVDEFDKEAKRIIAKISDEEMKKQANEGIEQLDKLRGIIESVALEFKKDGSMGLGGLETFGLKGASSQASKMKWTLSGNKLTLEAEGEKLNLLVSGSADKMKLTLTQSEMQAISKKSGEEIPAEVQKEIQAMGDISIGFKPAKK